MWLACLPVPSKIILFYEGTNGLSLKNGALQIKTSVGTLQETIPSSYQLLDAERKEIDCAYDVRGNLVQIKVNNSYDKSKTLVIDPQPVFISYSGSIADNWGFAATLS